VSYCEIFDIHAPAASVFDALLDQEILMSWLAEKVRIEPHKGGTLRFWGRDVIWCVSEDETEGEILELDRPHSLVFSWRWKGHSTRVSFGIEQAGATTRLSVEHHFETFDAGSGGPGPDMAGCHWRIAIQNLVSVLASGHASLRPDYTALAREGNQRVELEIEIDAPPERVFRALLDPAQVSLWMQAEAPEIDPAANRYSYGWHRGEAGVEVGPVRILELIPNQLLVHDWKWTDEPDGQVRWELSPTDAGTQLRLIHSESADITHALGWSDALISIQRLIDGPLGPNDRVLGHAGAGGRARQRASTPK
jgi:uncharacterized protein YndB with AHSA1/START domain